MGAGVGRVRDGSFRAPGRWGARGDGVDVSRLPMLAWLAAACHSKRSVPSVHSTRSAPPAPPAAAARHAGCGRWRRPAATGCCAAPPAPQSASPWTQRRGSARHHLQRVSTARLHWFRHLKPCASAWPWTSCPVTLHPCPPPASLTLVFGERVEDDAPHVEVQPHAHRVAGHQHLEGASWVVEELRLRTGGVSHECEGVSQPYEASKRATTLHRRS